MLKDDRLGQHVPTLHPSEPKLHKQTHTHTRACTHIRSAKQIHTYQRESVLALIFISAASEELKIAGMTFTTFDLGGHAQGEFTTFGVELLMIPS